MLNDYEAAFEDSRKALVIDDKLKEGYDCQIRCLLATGDHNGAIKLVQKLNEIDPDNDKRYAEQCKQQRSSVEEAIRCIEKNNFKTAGMYRIVNFTTIFSNEIMFDFRIRLQSIISMRR